MHRTPTVMPTRLLALLACTGLWLTGPVYAQSPATAVPAGRLSPHVPEAQLDPALLTWSPIATPQRRPTLRLLSAGAATQEVAYTVGTRQTSVSRVPAGELHGSTSDERRDQARESQPYTPQARASIQKVIGPDDRVRVGSSYPYSTQCKLFITFPDGHKVIGSGTLISAKHVLTAGHCVWSSEWGGWAKSIEVIPGLSGAYKPYGSAWADSLRTYRGYVEEGDSNHDFGLITLDREIGHRTGWFGYAYWPNITGYTANIAGYPGDLDDGAYQYYHSGPIDDADEFQVYYRIDTYGGQSGSGVYSIEENEERYVFAVHAWGNSSTNGGTRIDSTKFDSIEAWIEADR